jgi:hypothetical protein
MKYLVYRSSAVVSAGIAALAAAYLAHTVLGIRRAAVLTDALGMAACLLAFVGTGLFIEWRNKN